MHSGVRQNTLLDQRTSNLAANGQLCGFQYILNNFFVNFIKSIASW